ncbi:MAG: cupin domain-containing protein [Chloroflexi bacterium]|nr:cupin domain-containing protein [Chloroflexota bacterium]
MGEIWIVHADDLTPRTPPTRRVFVPFARDEDAPVHMGFVFMEPGGLMTPCHYHKQSTEIYFVLKGSGIITLDGEDHQVGEYGTVLVPPGVTHIWRNPHRTPLEYLWIMHPAHVAQDTLAVDTPAHIQRDFAALGSSRGTA